MARGTAAAEKPGDLCYQTTGRIRWPLRGVFHRDYWNYRPPLCLDIAPPAAQSR